MKMMRNLLASSSDMNRKGRSSSPSVATPVNNLIMALPLGSTDGSGAHITGSLTGISAQTQAQQVADYTGTLRYVAPKCYAIRGSFVSSNMFNWSNDPSNAVWFQAGTVITPNQDIGPLNDGNAFLMAINTPGNTFYRAGSSWGAVAGLAIISISAKKHGTNDWFLVQTDLTGGVSNMYVNVATGQIGTVQNCVASFVEPEENGYYRITCIINVTNPSAGNIAFYTTAVNGDPSAGGPNSVLLYNAMASNIIGLPVDQQLPVPQTPITLADPVTVCYGHLPDGTYLRPFYVVEGSFRYNIFEFSPRSKAMNVGDCIEAVASDGIRYYYEATAGTTAASAPVFNPTGTTVDGTVTFTVKGYCTIMGLELAPTGDANHPEGVVATLDDANFPATDFLMAFDIVPDAAYPTGQILSLAGATKFNYAGNLPRFIVNAQTRQAATPRAVDLFSRMAGRNNAVNTILYNNGAMFTGATGGPVIKNSAFFLGETFAAGQIKACILNLFIVNNSAINDTNAIARTRYDLHPFTAFSTDLNAELTHV